MNGNIDMRESKLNNWYCHKVLIAYRLLKFANLSKEMQALVQATISKLSLEQMKRQLRAAFDGARPFPRRAFPR